MEICWEFACELLYYVGKKLMSVVAEMHSLLLLWFVMYILTWQSLYWLGHTPECLTVSFVNVAKQLHYLQSDNR